MLQAVGEHRVLGLEMRALGVGGRGRGEGVVFVHTRRQTHIHTHIYMRIIQHACILVDMRLLI